ncbi:alkyl/aryl-sulfatase [Vallitalea pronyensis]|nr:alkyl sulfatase dimerization domain-containing protein [Vallitalea pronyensis]
MIKKRLLNLIRKRATPKTSRINQQSFKAMNMSKLAVEEQLAVRHMIKRTIPFIRNKTIPIPAWNLRPYEFLFENNGADSVNPKLWQQGRMNALAGLFQVTEQIYQIRGYDLANMNLIKGHTGWIVIGCLSSEETARAAIQFAKEQIKDFSISAVIITHSHADHYGGVLGVLDEADSKALYVYVPQGFMHAVIEENVYAGIAMSRRGLYMYGEILPRDPRGQIDCGIGKYVSLGNQTLTNRLIHIDNKNPKLSYTQKTIDGIPMQFQLTPDTEAPAEMNIYFPQQKTLCMAENCSVTMHNIYTLRGAKIRNPVAWAYYIQEAIDAFGKDLAYIFQVHNWPRIGHDDCIDFMEKQRDLYQYLNDQTLRLLNKGYTIDNIGKVLTLPDSLGDEWFNSQFYGTVNTNAKGIYQRYIGWYSGNPVDLNPLTPEEAGRKYLEYMGGEERMLEKATEDFKKGEYQWVAQAMKHIIYHNPDNKKAKELCADALEQLGYIAESGAWRNEYLMGAFELRFGAIKMLGSTITDDVLNALPLQNVLYLMSIRIDGVRAGDYNFTLGFHIKDTEQTAYTELKRGIFRYLGADALYEPDVMLLMTRKELYTLSTTNKVPKTIVVLGDLKKWDAFLDVLEDINPSFNIMTPLEQETRINKV